MLMVLWQEYILLEIIYLELDKKESLKVKVNAVQYCLNAIRRTALFAIHVRHCPQ